MEWTLVSKKTGKEVTKEEMVKALKKIDPNSFELQLANEASMYIMIRLTVWSVNGNGIPQQTGYTMEQEKAFAKMFRIEEVKSKKKLYITIR